MIIITHSRKELVRRQKACIDYVNKGISNGKEAQDRKMQEAVSDFKRWSKDSGVFKDKRGEKLIATFEKKGV